jgi:probable phosphomutase (TIGR03848 family)
MTAPVFRTVILLRHGRSTANTAGVLAGRSAGVNLDETGLAQAAGLVGRLAGVDIGRIVSSPLERCRQTVAPLAAAAGVDVEIDDDLVEVDYGDWTGRSLKDLGSEKLWRTVQQRPSAATFPGGESLATVSVRAVAAVRRLLEAELERPAAALLLCSHGDVIKSILADALGIHLDGFQRINVAPASLSVVRYSALRPIVERINYAEDLSALLPPPPSGDAPADVVPADSAQSGAPLPDAGSADPKRQDCAQSGPDAVVGGSTR